MRAINRRSFIAFISAAIPSIFLNKAEAAGAQYGALLAKSTAIKVGQTQVYGA